MKKFAKLLVLLLTVALVCGAIAMVVSADDTATEEINLVEAIAGATDGKVTLAGNAYLSQTVTVNQNLTIDLAGYTLTVNAATAFNIAANVEFNINGNGGVIELGGCLITSGAGVTPTAVVSDAVINHYGTAIADSNYSIIHVYNGTYTLENVNVTSTAVVPKSVYETATLPYEAFFNMARPLPANNQDSSNTEGANISFVSSMFFCDTSMHSGAGQAGFSAFNIVGNGRLTITDSYVDHDSSMFRLGYARAKNADGTNGPDVQSLTVENSTLKSNPKINYQRGEVIFAHRLDWANVSVYGTFYFKNSLLQNNGYRYCIGEYANTTNASSKVVFDGSVLKQAGGNGENDGMISRGIPFYLKNGSTLMSITQAGVGSTYIYVEKGTRFNMAGVVGNSALKSYDFETNTSGAALTAADIAYDPVGDEMNPWIYGGTASATFLPAGAEKSEKLTFDCVGGTGKKQYGFGQDGSGGVSGLAANFFHSAAKRGATCAVTYGEHTYYKYWVSPDTADANSKIGSKRTFSGDNSDPFFNIGDSESNKITERFAQFGTYKVAVYSYEIGTDSEYGYPKSDLGIGAREATGTGTNNKNGSSWATLQPDGTLTNNTLNDFPAEGVKLSTTKFNTLTLVAFIGETGAAATGYFYLNGEYIGYTAALTAAGANFLQGVRIMPKTGFAHTVGQSFVLDSVTRTRYASYLEGADTISKENADKYAPAYIPNTETFEAFDFVVGGNAYTGIEDAINAAMEEVEGENKQVRDIKLINPNPKPVVVNANVTITTYGNVLDIADGSYPAKINGDKNAPSSYTFDEAYNDYVVYYYWLRPGYTPQDDVFDPEVGTWEEEPEKYFYIQELKAGMTPAPEEGMIHYGSYDPETGVVKVHNGKWALPAEEETGSVFEPLTLEYVISNVGASVMIAPYYDEVTALYYVSDADCHIIRAGETDAEFTAEFRTVTSGETKTITLLDDAAFTEKNAELSGGNNASVTNLDLNGNMLEYRFGGTMAWVGKNMTLNIYSTAPGAEIYHAGWDGSRLISQRMLAISYGANKESNDAIETVYNAHINLGTIAGIEDSKGEYLSVYTAIIAEGVTGNDTCSIVIDGVHAERYHSESSGMIITRYYNGDIIIKNSTFINYAGNMIDMKGCLNDESVSKDKTEWNNPAIVVTPYVLFDNCTLINLDKTANLLGNNGDGYDGEFKDSEGNPLDVAHQLEFRNCVISCPEGKQINGSNQHERTVFTGKNIFSQTGVSDSVNLIDGQKVYNYYAPVTLESLGLEDLGGYAVITRLARNSDTGEFYNYSQAIVEYGAAIPEGFTEGNVYRLPRYFKTAFAHSEDEISVTYKDAEGNDIGTKSFYAGPTEAIGNGIPASAFGGANATVTAPAVADVNLVATKKVFAGWDKDVTNIKENTVVNATYNVVVNVDGVKANISLYSDFDVNLYIPEIYRDFVTVMYGEKTLDKLTTNREGYFKVTVDQLASEAASDVQFVVTVTEADETFTLNYSVNVANYAKYILEATEGYTEADKTLMTYVVAYANEAYKYANGGKANETLNTLATTYEAVATEKNYTAITNPAEISAVVKETNVILQSTPKFQFTIDKAFVGTVVIGGTAYTYETADEADRVVTVEGTRAYNFLDDITIKVGEAEGKYNYSAYAAYHVYNAENGTDEESKAASANALALINALYEYVNYAKTYNANK